MPGARSRARIDGCDGIETAVEYCVVFPVEFVADQFDDSIPTLRGSRRPNNVSSMCNSPLRRRPVRSPGNYDDSRSGEFGAYRPGDRCPGESVFHTCRRTVKRSYGRPSCSPRTAVATNGGYRLVSDSVTRRWGNGLPDEASDRRVGSRRRVSRRPIQLIGTGRLATDESVGRKDLD